MPGRSRSLKAFGSIKKEAWTWGRMALTRARVVAGDRPGGADRDLGGRQAERPGRPAGRRNHARRIDELAPVGLDVKQLRGGLVDLEFMPVPPLRHAAARPEVLDPRPSRLYQARRGRAAQRQVAQDWPKPTRCCARSRAFSA